MNIFPKTKWQKIRFSLLLLLLFGFVAIKLYFPVISYFYYTPKTGDVIFQSLPKQSDLVEAIEGATHSPYSHCGVVVYRHEEWQVIEAIGNVHYTPLWIWELRGRSSKFTVYRLKEKYEEIIPSFIKAMEKYLGRPYDFRYRMDEEKIYCSELVFKGFREVTGEEMGELLTLGDLDWEPYVETIKKYEGLGDTVPLDRIMITPRDLAKGAQLERIYN